MLRASLCVLALKDQGIKARAILSTDHRKLRDPSLAQLYNSQTTFSSTMIFTNAFAVLAAYALFAVANAAPASGELEGEFIAVNLATRIIVIRYQFL